MLRHQLSLALLAALALTTLPETPRAPGASELIVRFQPDVSASERDDLLARFDLERRYTSPYTGAVVVGVADDATCDALAPILRGSGAVRDVLRNTRIEGAAQKTSSSSKTTDALATGDVQTSRDADWMPSLALTTQEAGRPGDLYYPYEWNLKLQWVARAWAIGTSRGAGVGVAVLDTGVSPVPSLPASRILGGADFIDPGTAPTDDNGHGTHMATIIAGANAVVGVAPEASIIPVRVLGADMAGTEMALVDGLWYAASRPEVQVINMSLTFPRDYYPSPLLTEAVDQVAARGIVMVGAAGNDGNRTVGYPARLREVIAVGAYRLTSSSNPPIAGEPLYGSPAPYSNTGGVLDLCAFGGDVTTDADLDGLPDGILGERPTTALRAGGLYLTAGTSPAAAQVSGAAALLIANGVELDDVRPLLQTTAFRGAMGGNFDTQSGTGLLNVGRAMSLASTGVSFYRGMIRLHANPIVAFGKGGTAGDDVTAIVQVTGLFNLPVSGMRVYVHFGGAQDNHAVGTTDAKGVAVVKSLQKVLRGAAFVSVDVEAVVDPSGWFVMRPYGMVNVDKLSYELLSNFGTGLISSAIVLDYSADRLASTGYVSSTKVQQTYQLRSFGTGLISSAIVFGMSPTYYTQSGLAQKTLLFTTLGTGLISSAIILDRNFFSDAALTGYGKDTLMVRNYTLGSGLISSAIIWKGATYAYDSFFTGTNPGVWTMTTGTGLISSAIIWNGAQLLRNTLYSTSLPTGTSIGTPDGTHVLPYDPTSVSLAGGSWATVTSQYPSGTGLISSALVSVYNPYSVLTSYSGYIDPTRRYVGTSEATVPFPR